MTEIAKDKARFRQTSKWKNFRKKLKEERKVDEITGKPLYKGFQVHHLDLDESHYKDLTDKSHFATLNSATHDTIHWLYRYYEKDPEIIGRLEELLRRMKELNDRS